MAQPTLAQGYLRRQSRRSRAPIRRAGRAIVETVEPRLLLARPVGIDVSHWQGTINWTSVHNAGYSFAWQ